MGLPQLGLLVLSVGLSYLSGRLLAKKNKALLQDDKPTPLATRGSYVPRLLGRRRVGYVWGWAGDRARTRETTAKKAAGAAIGYGLYKGYKYLSTTRVKVWRESGWHLLAVGPGKALHSIEANGKVIFEGPITPNSHPSGSTVDLGTEGSFAIFWGENTQPINTFLGNANRVTVSSRWPFFFYIVWIGKRLGEVPVWPLMTYDIEIAPAETHLSGTPAFMDPALTLDGPTVSIDEIVNGAAGTAKFVLIGHHEAAFPNLGKVHLTGNTGLSDADYDILKTVVRIDMGLIKTDVFPTVALSGGTDDGQIQAYTLASDDGYNPAHLLAELWLSEWPHGIKQPADRFDLATWESFGSLAVTENLKTSVIAIDGQDLQTVMGSLMQDCGVLQPINFATGKIIVQPVREPISVLPTITEDVLVEVPETEILQGPAPVDRVIFSFLDRENNFREMTIGIDDAGQASFQEFFRARTVQISSTINFDTASVIAERRSQEELADKTAVKIVTNRGARLLIPGTQIIVDGVPQVLQIASVQIDPLSGRVTLQCIVDFLAATKSDFEQNKALLLLQQKVSPDPQFQLMEIPEWLSGPVQLVSFLRLRANSAIDGSFLHISRDNMTFSVQGFDESLMQGGTLAEALDAEELWEIDVGPTFNAVGPDIGTSLDLSSDLVNWRRGRQLCIIGNEIFFLKTIEFVSGNTYRLRGLIRARFDTRVEAHSIGDEVYIVQDDDGLPIDDLLLEPQVTLYGKSQASGNGLVDLVGVPSESLALYGKGIRPIPVEAIRFDTLTAPSGTTTHEWSTGDLPITWGYFTPRTPGTGAGFGGAGSPQSAADPEGDFLVEILDASDVLKRSVTVSTNVYTYTSANRTADFGGEPSVFKARVTQLRGGLSAAPTVQTFTHVT